MAPLPDAEQFDVIRTTAFFTNAQTKMRTVIAAMQEAQFAVEGEIKAEVDGVPVSFEQVDEHDADFKAGHSGSPTADYFYSWRIPMAWVMPVPAP